MRLTLVNGEPTFDRGEFTGRYPANSLARCSQLRWHRQLNDRICYGQPFANGWPDAGGPLVIDLLTVRFCRFVSEPSYA